MTKRLGPINPKFLRGTVPLKDWPPPQHKIPTVLIPYFALDKQLVHEMGIAMRRVLAGDHLPKERLPGHIPPPDDPGLCECDGAAGHVYKCGKKILEWAWCRYCAAYPEEVF